MIFTTNLQVILVTFNIKINLSATTHKKQFNIVIIRTHCDHLLKRKHPRKIINYSFTKLFQPGKHERNDKDVITFTRTFNPNHQFSFS